MSLELCLEAIRSPEEAPANSLLYHLSDLSASDVVDFASAWGNAPLEGKVPIVDRLINLSQDMTELDFSAVFRRCLRDEDEEVRRRAIEGLWENEERRLIAPLGDLLAHDPSPAVRAAAAMGLGKFAELAQLDKLLRKDGLSVEVSLLAVLQNNTEDMTVRRRALESVAVFNSPKVDEFIRWFYGSDDLTLKGSALYAMGRTGETHWLECLVRETRSPSPTLRFEAANACGQLEEEDVIPHLIPLMQDDDLQVQLAAIRAVGAIGGPLAKKALRRCIRDGDAAVEDAARESLETVDAIVDVYSFNYLR